MQYHFPLILFALSCGIVSGQRLTEAFGPVSGFPVSWKRNSEPARTSGDSSATEAAQKRAAFQAALDRKEIIEDIIYLKLSSNALASIYRACTGRRVMVSPFSDAAEFRLVQAASPQDPITYAQLAEIIKKSAIIEGFKFTPDAGVPDLDILDSIKTEMRCVHHGLPVLNENDPLPEDDSVISYIIILKHLEPTKAAAIFAKIAVAPEPYGSIAVIPNASCIVATQRTSIIRKLITLKSEIDKP